MYCPYIVNGRKQEQMRQLAIFSETIRLGPNNTYVYELCGDAYRKKGQKNKQYRILKKRSV